MSTTKEESSDERLILPNAKDKVATLIEEKKREQRNLKKRRRISEREDRLRPAKRRFAEVFVTLATCHLGVERNDLHALSKEELQALETFVAREAFRKSLKTRALFQFPVLGWLAHGFWHLSQETSSDNRPHGYDPRPSKEWTYRYLRGLLQKAFRDDWFPHDDITTELTHHLTRGSRYHYR